MSNDSDKKISRSERRQMLKRQQQMRSIGMMIIGVLIIIAAVVVISLMQPGVSKAEEKPYYALENMNGLGDPNAPVVIEIYSSFACIHCKNFSDEAEGEIIENYVNSGDVYLVYKSFNSNPTDIYGMAGQAAYCAGDQNNFWKMHDLLFANFSTTGFTASQLVNFARATDLDTDQFQECLSSNKYAESVLSDFETGYELGITGTPSFTLNGEVIFRGNVPYENFADVIEEALAAQN